MSVGKKTNLTLLWALCASDRTEVMLTVQKEYKSVRQKPQWHVCRKQRKTGCAREVDYILVHEALGHMEPHGAHGPSADQTVPIPAANAVCNYVRILPLFHIS